MNQFEDSIVLRQFGDLTQLAQRRSRTYWLLSRCLWGSPCQESLQEIRNLMGTLGTRPSTAWQPLLDETNAFADALQVALSNAGELQAVAVDFTRLFGGVSEAYGSRPPYESAARSGTWGGDIAVAVAAVYASAEIEPPVPTGAPHDHLVAELGFLAIACVREAEAWQLGNRNAALDWVMQQREFLDQHLLKWLPDYCRQLAGLAQSSLYRALLDLLPNACLIDREDIESILLDAELLAAHG